MANLEIADRVDIYKEAEPVITLKDHKDDFVARPKCRLINPAKSNVGKISKIILDNINKKIRAKTGANQWICSRDVVKWFEGLEEKESLTFIKFDIETFYPAITRKLFIKALDYAKQFIEISDEEIEILLNARKTFVTKDGDKVGGWGI